MRNIKNKFLEIVRQNIKRDGIEDLLKWMDENGFYECPASSKYHGNYEGGLVEHSINTYENLVKLNSIYNLCDNDETIAIISLFHDLTKIGCYVQDFKNVKDEFGKWNKVPYFAFNEQFCYGSHGGKSVYLILKYMKLTDLEAVAINVHMGQFDKPNGSYEVTNAFEMFPLAMLLHLADMISTYISENKSLNKEDDKDNQLKTSIQTILDLFKQLINEKHIDKDEIYDIIAVENDGHKNPNSIKNIDIANKIIELLKEKLSGESTADGT